MNMTDNNSTTPALAETTSLSAQQASIWVTLFIAVFLVFAPSILIGALFGLYGHFTKEEPFQHWFASIDVQLMLMAFSLPLAGYFVFLFTRLFNHAKFIEQIYKYLHIKPIGYKEVFIWIVLSTAVWGAIATFGIVADLPEEAFMIMIRDSATSPLLVVLVVCVLAPIVEELIFRGLIFKRFQQSILASSGAAVMTCLTFTLIHAQQYSPSGLFIIFIIAAYLTWVRLKTNNTTLAIVAHATNNILSTIALYFVM